MDFIIRIGCFLGFHKFKSKNYKFELTDYKFVTKSNILNIYYDECKECGATKSISIVEEHHSKNASDVYKLNDVLRMK